MSVVVSNLYMEDVEQKALTTAHPEVRPRLWRRFVDDSYEVLKRAKVEEWTAHLNQIDSTGSIKFTCEVEQDGQIAFLDTKTTRKQDGTIKVEVYRKKTHTDQYLSFNSHHPLNHKLGVVRTLLDRVDSVVTEASDREAEVEHIQKALSQNGYPKWAIDRVKKRTPQRSESGATASSTSDHSTRGVVTIPYVATVSESLARVYKKHNIKTVMKPAAKLRETLVHPKDKRPLTETTNSVYRIPCKSCPKAYVGESSRKLQARLAEHKNSVRKVEGARFTRSQRNTAAETWNQSALADHASQENHVIDWDNVTVQAREDQKPARWIREAIHIRKEGQNAINRDEGQHQLPKIYNPLLKTATKTSRQ